MRRSIRVAALVGAVGAFALGFALAAAQNARVEERLRAANPELTKCGLGFCGEIGVGLFSAVPGAILGALVGARVSRPRQSNGSNS